MSPRRKQGVTGALLDLWRPPHDSGDPIGCLATTYTFAPGLFDEQCLARFLDIESEPDREDLAFLLERETRLESVYAGVLVDHSQSGVEHSLRWDVLPVRIRGAKQHAKLTLLAWSSHIRVIVSSANLTEQGYRTNHEVAATADGTPSGGATELLLEACDFLADLVRFVPAGAGKLATVTRAEEFLGQVRRQLKRWEPDRRRESVRQHLVCTLPGVKGGAHARSALDEAMQYCRARGGSPDDVRIASPFFDGEVEAGNVMATCCKAMARGAKRRVILALPGVDDETVGRPRLNAPKALLSSALKYVDEVSVGLLPHRDADKNVRVWHAKMLGFSADPYVAVMVGSSNFTTAGLGTAPRRNAEVNLLTLVAKQDFSRDPRQLEAVWPEMERIDDPESAEWRGVLPEQDEEEMAPASPPPPGFLAAIYRAGEDAHISLWLDPEELPRNWSVSSASHDAHQLLTAEEWRASGTSERVEVPWWPVLPPEKLVVRWDDSEAFLPLNAEDQRALPPPAHLEHMTADDMLSIIAASDPSAAFRAWARGRQRSELFDDDLDSAVPVDLDPLRRFDLHATFLHRVRRRARVLAQMRSNLERPVWSKQALDWRLRGLIGIAPLAERLTREIAGANGGADEALLTLADFFIVLCEVNYQPAAGDVGAVPKRDFEAVFRPFLQGLATDTDSRVRMLGNVVSAEPLQFWGRVLERCRE